jgi:drug/metabolite transporter (DMT)-like permease
MPDPLAHVYDLALRALAEQERQVTALHGRLAPVLAAGGLAATLLAPAAFRGERPAGAVATIGVVIGLVGVAVLVLAGAYVLLPAPLSFGLDACAAAAALRGRPDRDARAVYAALTDALDRRRIGNATAIRRLHVAFTVMVCGMLVEVCGLAAAVAIG